jgi:Protein of unknown function (DUF559)
VRWEVPEDLRRRMVEVARHLRQEATPSEDILWEALRGNKLGVRFRRQQPIGPFVIDFCAPPRTAWQSKWTGPFTRRSKRRIGFDRDCSNRSAYDSCA